MSKTLNYPLAVFLNKTFQERNFGLQREREALREALERMQEELMNSESRCEMFRSQLQAMKQLFEHQKR